MPRRSAGPELPVALVVHPDELAVRSLESVLSPAGFSVLRAYSGAEAAAQVRRHRPDAVILGSDLGDATGLALSRTLRGDPEVASSMPIFLVHAGPTSRQDRLEALRAGADDLWSQPLDTEEFVLRLAAAARAKLDADRARKAGLVDPTTGLYNEAGLTRRTGELLAEGARRGRPVSVVVFGADPAPDPGEGPKSRLGSDLALALGAHARASDAVGRLGEGWVGIAAPTTDAERARRLAERLLDTVERHLARSRRPAPRLSAGYHSVADPGSDAGDAAALIARAVTALRTRTADGRIRPWAGDAVA